LPIARAASQKWRKPPLPGYFKELIEGGHISAEASEKIAWRNAERALGL
jgi:hypothetical protein